jgi:hypothetical protein
MQTVGSVVELGEGRTEGVVFYCGSLGVLI